MRASDPSVHHSTDRSGHADDFLETILIVLGKDGAISRESTW